MKKLYFYIFLFSVIILCVCGYLLYTVSFGAAGVSSENFGYKGVTVIIDAGHGGVDGGAAGNDGTYEKDLNLIIALDLREILNSFGISTVMTRSTDDSIHDKSAETIREKKVSDIRNRMKIMENTDNSVFVSIHQNSYTSSKYSGTQVFYSPKTEGSKALALAIQNSAVSLLQPENKRQIKECGSSVYLIYNAVKPAVLVECGFMTNDSELELLKSRDYQRKMAYCIALGIIDYLKGS